MKPQSISSMLVVGIFAGLIYVNSEIDASCLGGLAACCGLETSESFGPTQEHFEQWYRHDLPRGSLQQAYAVIDEHLRKEVNTANLERNIYEMKSLLSRELIAADPDRRVCDRLFRKRPSLAGRLQSKDPGVIINALFRLIKLEETDATGLKCSLIVTRHIALNNRIASDPIGRRKRGKPALLRRIDNLIVNSAIDRAHFCIPVYRDQIRAVGQIKNEYVVSVINFWTIILGRRMRDENIDQSAADLDKMFTLYPEDALKRVKQIEHPIDQNEVDLVIEFLDERPQTRVQRIAEQHFPEIRAGISDRASKFKGCLVDSCVLYVRLVFVWFESLDFDMRLRDYIQQDIVEMITLDQEVNKQRAFHHMCRKLLNEKDRITQLIDQQD